MRRSAIFDIDGTILWPQSGILYVQHLWKKGEISLVQILRIAWWHLLHDLGLNDMHKVARVASAPYRGTLESDMIEDCDVWFERDVVKHIFPDALRHIRTHLERGEVVVLITGASPYLAEPLSRYLGIPGAFRATRLEVRNGRFTGVVSRVVYGREKLKAARELAKECGFVLEESYAYADSITDRCLLEAVGRPVAVNPDLRLWIHAKRKGWKVVRWRKPWPWHCR